MSTDREILKQAEAGRVGSLGFAADPMTTVKAAHRRSYRFASIDATAGTGVAESVVCRVPVACRFISAHVTAPIAVTASGTDYKTFTIAKRTAAGAAVSLAAIATITTTGVSLAAFVPQALTLDSTTASLDLAAGDVITYKNVKTGVTGVATSDATSYTEIEVIVEENGA